MKYRRTVYHAYTHINYIIVLYKESQLRNIVYRRKRTQFELSVAISTWHFKAELQTYDDIRGPRKLRSEIWYSLRHAWKMILYLLQRRYAIIWESTVPLNRALRRVTIIWKLFAVYFHFFDLPRIRGRSITAPREVAHARNKVPHDK